MQSAIVILKSGYLSVALNNKFGSPRELNLQSNEIKPWPQLNEIIQIVTFDEHLSIEQQY